MRALRSRHMPAACAACGIAAAGLVYFLPVRRWFNRWGTTTDEVARHMLGDDLIADPTNTAMQAVTIDAGPGDVWPWLVQIGYGRGGLYSYDWLDRVFGFLDGPSANDILPEFQNLVVGDAIPWGHGEFLTVARLDPPRAMALEYHGRGMDWVWQFGLYPIDETRTRLVTRGTERTPKGISWRLAMLIMEPASFIMTTRMLFGVKRRAETLRLARDAKANGG